MSKKDKLLRKLVIIEVLINPTHDLITEQMESPDAFLSELLSKVRTPIQHAFSKNPLDYLKVYGYKVNATVLPRNITKAFDLNFTDAIKPSDNE